MKISETIELIMKQNKMVEEYTKMDDTQNKSGGCRVLFTPRQSRNIYMMKKYDRDILDDVVNDNSEICEHFVKTIVDFSLKLSNKCIFPNIVISDVGFYMMDTVSNKKITIKMLEMSKLLFTQAMMISSRTIYFTVQKKQTMSKESGLVG